MEGGVDEGREARKKGRKRGTPCGPPPAFSGQPTGTVPLRHAIIRRTHSRSERDARAPRPAVRSHEPQGTEEAVCAARNNSARMFLMRGLARAHKVREERTDELRIITRDISPPSPIFSALPFARGMCDGGAWRRRDFESVTVQSGANREKNTRRESSSRVEFDCGILVGCRWIARLASNKKAIG